MKQADPEQVTKKEIGGAMRVKVDDEMRSAAEDIFGGNAAITLKDLNAALRRRLPNKPHITDAHQGRFLGLEMGSEESAK